MRVRSFLPIAAGILLSTVVGCSQASSEEDASGTEDAITSNAGKILDFKFEGEVVASSETSARAAVVSQLMYVQGILTTARNGNGHVNNVKLSNVTESAIGNTRTKRIKYSATLPVAWPKDITAPRTYEFQLPKDATKLSQFNAKYDGRCGNNEYGQDVFWHDWNPKAAGCTIDAADVVKVNISGIGPSAKATQNKYPEYDQIWQDDRLDIVAIFGIISSNMPGDDGYIEAKSFLDNSKSQLTGAVVKDNDVGSTPSILKDQTLTGKINVGGRPRDVKIDIIVVQEMKSVGADFDTRYNPISEKADMILYNGHAGLGQNVNALARKGKVAANKYQLVLLNGCQTFAYIDTTLTDRRREANGAASDPDGTKYLDIIGNALPGYANNLAAMSNVLFDAVVKSDTAPRHYNDLLSDMPESHIVVVFGEEDNRFQP